MCGLAATSRELESREGVVLFTLSRRSAVGLSSRNLKLLPAKSRMRLVFRKGASDLINPRYKLRHVVRKRPESKCNNISLHDDILVYSSRFMDTNMLFLITVAADAVDRVKVQLGHD